MIRAFFLYFLAGGFLGTLGWVNPALAAGQWQSSDYLQARLIAGPGTETVPGALEVKIAADWHAYWRMPGDGGLAPQFDWAHSTNVKDVKLLWPAPARFTIMDLHSFGYSDSVVFPITITPEDNNKPVQLALDLNMMVCHEICVPQFLTVTLDNSDATAQETPDAGLIRAARDSLPFLENRPGLKINNMVIGPEALVITAFSQRGFEQSDLFVEIDDDFLMLTAPPVITIDAEETRQALIKIPVPEDWDDPMALLDGKTVTLTLTDGTEAVEQSYHF